MRFLILILLTAFAIAGLGCSKDESTSEKAEEPASLAEPQEPAKQTPKVVPVILSPEDQEKAKLAPEGMVFIKGGCFIMGNDYAQEDENPNTKFASMIFSWTSMKSRRRGGKK